MTDVTNILYWISTGLLIPVIALLLFGFVKALLLLGSFFGMYINRLKYLKQQKLAIDNIQLGKTENLDHLLSIKGNKLWHLAATEYWLQKNNQCIVNYILIMGNTLLNV